MAAREAGHDDRQREQREEPRTGRAATPAKVAARAQTIATLSAMRGAACDAKGWQSQLGYDPREGEWPEAFVLCPESREFD